MQPRPNVDAGVVGAGTQKDVRGAVPQCHYFVEKVFTGIPNATGETEICEFELALGVDEQILGFKVAMQDAVIVAECYSLEELVHE